MAQPVAYVPITSFIGYQASQPWFPGQNIDVELNALKNTTDQVRANLALIQRDDGLLANGVVTYNSLSATLQTAGLAPLTVWQTGATYTVPQAIVSGSSLYQCAISHVSGVFATDLAAGKWTLLATLPSGSVSNGINHGVAIATGATSVTSTAAMTDGQLLVGQSAADPLPKSITGDISLAKTGVTTIASIGGAAVTGSTGTGNVVLSNLPTLIGVVLAPTANSTNKALSATQTSPTIGSIAGPLVYNKIAINNQEGVTGAGATNSLLDASTRGLYVTFTEGGTNISGIQSAAVFELNHTVGNSSAVGGDHVASISTVYSNKVEAGGGGIYGLDAIAYADAGSNVGAATGINSETYVSGTATVPYRLGLEVTNIGPAVGSTFDAAIAIDNTVLGGAFLNGISFGANPIRPQPIAATGSLFSTAQNFTVANIMNMPGLTVTGNYFNFGHLGISGTGFISTAANSSALPTAPAGTQIQACAGDATSTYVLSDSFATNGGGYFLSRAARGTSAAPTALQTGDPLGGWAAMGRGATVYSATGRASVAALAAQNWTDANQGTYVEIGTTANGSTTQTVRARVENDGGVLIPPTVSGGSKGAGTLNISTGYYVNGSAILAPLSYTTPISYNAGTGAVSLTTVPISLGGTGATAGSGTVLDNISGFAATGILTRTAAGTYLARTIVGGAGITVTNGDGVAGNPSIAATAKSPLIFAQLATGLAAGVTNYIAPGGLASSVNEALAQVAMPFACTISNLYANFDTSPSAGKNRVITVRKNGVDTALTTTVSGTNTINSDLTHSVSFAAQDLLSVKIVTDAASTVSSGQAITMQCVG